MFSPGLRGWDLLWGFRRLQPSSCMLYLGPLPCQWSSFSRIRHFADRSFLGASGHTVDSRFLPGGRFVSALSPISNSIDTFIPFRLTATLFLLLSPGPPRSARCSMKIVQKKIGIRRER